MALLFFCFVYHVVYLDGNKYSLTLSLWVIA